jgi:hypothetical protein
VRHVLEFAVLAAVLIAIPGPSVLFTVSRALTVGRRPALFTVAGNELGGCVQVAAVAFGGNLHGREGGWSYPGSVCPRWPSAATTGTRIGHSGHAIGHAGYYTQ